VRALTKPVAATILVLSGACGSPPPPAAAPPLDVPAVSASARPVTHDTRTLPSVPTGATLILRIRDFTAVGREIVAMMGAPPSWDATVLLHSFVDPDVLAAVDLAAPMEGMNIDNPNRAAAGAFTLRADGESILRERFELRSDGTLSHLVKRHRDQTGRGMPSCALYAGRLVCALEEETLAAAAPYLVTTLSAEPLDHAIRITVPGTTIRNRAHGKTAPPEDRLANDLVLGLEREIDRLDFDLDLGTTVDATVTLHLLSREAPLTKALVPSGRVAAPPADFARLPGDALLASWSNGIAAEDLAPLKKVIADDLQATLESDGYAPEAAKASIDELAALFLTGGPFVLAAGKTKSTWLVAGVAEPAQRWTNGLRALVKKSDEAERTRKKPASSTPRHPDSDDVAARIVPIPASAKVPPDSLHIELKFTPKKKGAGPVRITHLWVVPQGDRTWIGYGDDDATVRDRLRAATDATAAGPIADRTKALVGGHSTTNGLVTLFASDKSVLAGAGNDRISVSAVTDAKSLVVRLQASRQATSDFVKTFF
jgi:hypothetical protein